MITASLRFVVLLVTIAHFAYGLPVFYTAAVRLNDPFVWILLSWYAVSIYPLDVCLLLLIDRLSSTHAVLDDTPPIRSLPSVGRKHG